VTCITFCATPQNVMHVTFSGGTETAQDVGSLRV
jgi:hypothetical protein